MTVERLLEAIMRLAKASGKPFINAKMDIEDEFYADPITRGLSRDKASFYRVSKLSLYVDANWVFVARAEVDINGIVLKLEYDDKAAWWHVRPVQEAMEGK